MAYTMERRMSRREPRVQCMQVYSYGMLVAHGRCVDMSEHGLLLHIYRDYSADELDPGSHLDVLLECEVPEWLPIRVVRKWNGGIAARFVGVA